jgi:hypothetical protein
MDAPLNAPAYRDRRTGLIIFGIVEVIIGCVCLLFAPLALLGQVMAAKATGNPPEFKIILPSLITYPLLAVAFIWLGVGSMKRLRWARALSLIVAWSWLLVGCVSLIMFIAMSPRIFANAAPGQPLPPEMRAVMIVVGALTLGLFFVALPGTLVLFYRSRHVKATCEAADPEVRWTDACPLPVLAVSIWLLFAAVWMPLMPLLYHSVFPFFGVLLHGFGGTLIFLILTVVWLYAAWAIYRLKPIGWWLTLVTFGVMTISSAVTFSKIDLMEMYRAMGYSEEMLKQIQQVNFFAGSHIVAMTLVGAALIIGYLLFIYRYFRSPAQVEPQAPPTSA